MNKLTLRRRLVLTLPLALLASCNDDKKHIIGEQIPVLPDNDAFGVALNPPPIVVPPAAALDSWPQELVAPAHNLGNIAGPTTLNKAWTHSIGEAGGYRQPLHASPLIATGRVFTMDANATVEALALKDGAQIWRTRTKPKHASEQNIGGGIAYAQNRLYVSTGYAELLCIDADSGKILWRQSIELPARSAPTIADSLVTVLVQNDGLLSFDAASGTPGWRFSGSVGQNNTTASVQLSGAPAFADGIIVAGFSSGTLAAIDANSGTALWEKSLSSSFGQASTLDFTDIVAAPVIANGVVYAISLGNVAIAVNLHSGAKVWSHSATGTQTFCIAGNFAYLLDQNQHLYAIEADDGLVSWLLELPGYHNMKSKSGPQTWSAPLMLNSELVFVNTRGEMARVDPQSGKLISITKFTSEADLSPISAAGVLLQLDRNANLTAYS